MTSCSYGIDKSAQLYSSYKAWRKRNRATVVSQQNSTSRNYPVLAPSLKLTSRRNPVTLNATAIATATKQNLRRAAWCVRHVCLDCHGPYCTNKVHLGVVGSNEFLEDVQRLAVQWNRVGHVEWARETRSQVLGVVFRHLGQATSVRRDLYGVWTTHAHGQLCPTRSPAAVRPSNIREGKHKAVGEQV